MKGLTLIELLFAVAVLSITLLIGLPNLNLWLQSIESKTQIAKLKTAMNLARHTAIKFNQPVSICPLDNTLCSSDWNHPIAVFHDNPAKNPFFDQQSLIKVIGTKSERGQWHSRQNIKGVITFNQNGFAFGSATTLLYCPEIEDKSTARRVILNLQGRIKVASYLSSKGTPYASLGAMTCQ